MSIRGWLGLEVPIIKYKYFNLDWKKDKTPRVIWTNTHPSNYNFKKIIKWRHSNVIITGNFDDITDITDITEKHSAWNTPFLKSALQKAIRRGQVETSIIIANELLIRNVNILVRRLTIILVEDTTYIKKPFEVMCWILFSGLKNIPDYFSEWILGVVKQMSELKEYSELYLEYPVVTPLENEDQTIQLRRSFGCFGGENNLFGRTISFIKNNNQLPKFRNILIVDVKRLTLNYFIKNCLCAIDFHCSDIIDKLVIILNSDYKFKKTELREMIWNYRSSINIRNSPIIIIPDHFLKISSIIDEESKKIVLEVQGKKYQ
jgi:hypothetical protein